MIHGTIAEWDVFWDGDSELNARNGGKSGGRGKSSLFIEESMIGDWFDRL